MKIKSLIAGLLLVSCSSFAGCWHHAPSDEKWIAQDKYLHAGFSAALGAGASVITKDTEHPFINAVGLAMIPGVAKEVFDARCGGSGFSHKDLTADLVGAILGASVGNAYFYFNGNQTFVGYKTDF